MKDIDGIFRLACDYWDQGRIHAAFRLFLKAAKAGDSSAQLNLSVFYSEGLGIRRKNSHKELYWLKKSFETGYSVAASNIGIFFLKKNKSYSKIIRWLLIANTGEAYFRLGKFYMDKLHDNKNARRYLSMSLEPGDICEATEEAAEALLTALQ